MTGIDSCLLIVDPTGESDLFRKRVHPGPYHSPSLGSDTIKVSSSFFFFFFFSPSVSPAPPPVASTKNLEKASVNLPSCTAERSSTALAVLVNR